MEIASTTKYLSENISEWTKSFIHDAGFTKDADLEAGVVSLLDSLRHYTEEGEKIEPEVLLTTSLKQVSITFPNPLIVKMEPIQQSRSALSQILKRCAPLAKKEWTIFVEVGKGNLDYGLISTRKSELSRSFRLELISNAQVIENATPFLYIRNTGGNTIEVTGPKQRFLISLSLSKTSDIASTQIPALATKVTSKLNGDIKQTSEMYFNALFESVLPSSHGCIIAILNDTKTSIKKFRKKIPDGVFFCEPIDLVSYVRRFHSEEDTSANTSLQSFKALVTGLLNCDGITLFSNQGKILGYNCFIKQTPTANKVQLGGARKRAFETLCELNLCEATIMKSQDGETIYREINNG